MAARSLKSKRAVLTGASSGLGRELTKSLAESGVQLVINARRADKLNELANEFQSQGIDCEVVAGDIIDERIQDQLIETCIHKFGGLDCVINNAGVGAMGNFSESDPQRIRKIFELNFFAMTSLIHKAIPHLTEGTDPLIVNIGSILGHRAAPLKSEYSASKFAVHGFSDALRAELSSGPIDVLLVSPSTIASEFFDAAIEDTTGKNWLSSSAMDPSYVARKITMAMAQRKHELILPFSGKMLVWLDRLFPSLANRIVARYGQ